HTGHAQREFGFSPGVDHRILAAADIVHDHACMDIFRDYRLQKFPVSVNSEWTGKQAIEAKGQPGLEPDQFTHDGESADPAFSDRPPCCTASVDRTASW